jgi:aldose sugar dehydrogenase
MTESRRLAAATICAAVLAAATGAAQSRASPPLPPLPTTLVSSEYRIRVVPIATDLANPWSVAFLPDGSLLLTERPGRLRLVRDGVLDPTPVAGVPAVQARVLGGLLEVALHPRFAENRFVYLTYSKARDDGQTTTALARGRFDGRALQDVDEIFVANNWSTSVTNYGGRLAFDRDGMLYLGIGERQEEWRAQKGDDHGGKVLRLHDDGRVPRDNPFVGREGYAPEVYSLGHRSPQGLAVHPETGAVWQHEHGPLGGDELNVILPGRN